ncbi:DUF1289 domain-containing protein [Paracoccus tegillarcae]|uniref:DUF1289 domain-containing protein n=1 Tax=Paracoccus tegillarcae TaxID=1529068 RepID=A0A2K9EWQ3_9RHOB|nr:DUF1289 domain-containing protein [Paracoccus tegillarcae]AUH35376.1 DUF1289 domain-containing protein [Paracoccus tegillarcae]
MNEAIPVWTRMEPQSPCVNICVMHPQEGICVGCYRTLSEIAGWAGMTAAARQAVLDELPERKPRLKKRRGGRAGRQG